jgi:hypothetical protein
MTSESATVETASGQRVTPIVESVDAIEPMFCTFVRGTARWLDPFFPQRGSRSAPARGGWTGDDAVETQMQEVDEVDPDGRGLRLIRLYRMTPPGGPFEGALRVAAVGLPDGFELELRWNFVASDTEVRGTSAELTVEGRRKEECLADFRRWFAGGRPAAR